MVHQFFSTHILPHNLFTHNKSKYFWKIFNHLVYVWKTNIAKPCIQPVDRLLSHQKYIWFWWKSHERESHLHSDVWKRAWKNPKTGIKNLKSRILYALTDWSIEQTTGNYHIITMSSNRHFLRPLLFPQLKALPQGHSILGVVWGPIGDRKEWKTRMELGLHVARKINERNRKLQVIISVSVLDPRGANKPQSGWRWGNRTSPEDGHKN